MGKNDVDLYNIGDEIAEYLGITQVEFINTVDKIVNNKHLKGGGKKMKNREQLRELILTMGEDGKEIRIEELAQVEGIVDELDINKKAQKNAKLQRVRTMVRAVFRAEGKEVRSIKKNVYKVIDEKSAVDCHAELNRLIKQQNKSAKRVNEFKDQMLKKGFAVQVEMTALVVDGGEAIAQNTKQNTSFTTSRTSRQSKKAVNG